MDNNLRTTIQKIMLLAEQNPEFKHEMQKIFGGKASAALSNDDKQRITNIERYLGLDYYVDSMPSLIDYSFIEDSEIRAQLISDNREMLRFRYGTRFHSIKFDEFCRYAQLQAEMLINFYYFKAEDDLQNIIGHIKKYNPDAYISEKAKTLGDIPFSIKLWAFERQFAPNIYNVFDNVRRMRNEQSHRSPQELEFSISKYQENLSKWHIATKEDGSINWGQTQKDELGKNMYESIKNKPEFKQYIFHVWLKREPFDEIIDALKSLAACVKNETT